MIYFFDKIAPFQSDQGILVDPQEMILTNDQKVYFLGNSWRDEIEKKGGVIVELDSSLIPKIGGVNG